MRQCNVVSRILLILIVITFALAAPTLIQDRNKGQAYVDVVQGPEDVITVLGKRMDEDFRALWKYYDDEWRNQDPPAIHIPNVPTPDPAEVPGIQVPPPNPAEVPEMHVPPPSPAEVPEVHATPPQVPADSDRESVVLNDDAPVRTSPESGPSHSPPTNPESSTISNAPSAESRSENLKAVDSEMKENAKVERRISGTSGGFDTVDTAQMEFPSAVDPWL